MPRIVVQQQRSPYQNNVSESYHQPLLTPADMVNEQHREDEDSGYDEEIVEEAPRRRKPAAQYDALFGLMANRDKVVNTDGRISRDTYEELEEPEIPDDRFADFDDEQSDVNPDELKHQLDRSRSKQPPARAPLGYPSMPDDFNDPPMPWDAPQETAEQRYDQIQKIRNYNDKNANKARDELLARIDYYKRSGYPLAKEYNYTHSREELISVVNQCETTAESDSMLKIGEGSIVAMTGFIEFVNGNVSPYKLALNGWSTSVAHDIRSFGPTLMLCIDEIKLYIGTGKTNPFLMLFLMITASGAYYHFSSPADSNGKQAGAPAAGPTGVFAMLNSFKTMLGGMFGSKTAPPVAPVAPLRSTTSPVAPVAPAHSTGPLSAPHRPENDGYYGDPSVVADRFTDTTQPDFYMPTIKKTQPVQEQAEQDIDDFDEIDDLDDFDDIDDASDDIDQGGIDISTYAKKKKTN